MLQSLLKKFPPHKSPPVEETEFGQYIAENAKKDDKEYLEIKDLTTKNDSTTNKEQVFYLNVSLNDTRCGKFL